jgi:hypothetical protein
MLNPPNEEERSMGAKAHPSPSKPFLEHTPAQNESQRAAVLRALEDIQNSNAFRTSERCKQFLSYIVERTLEGHRELLKERTLGVDLFHRRPTYMTAEDSIVRVEAGDVRRRLMQYYATEAQSPKVRIELPVGSYIPEFHWDTLEAAAPMKKTARFPATARFRLLAITLAALGLIGLFAFILGGHKEGHPASVVDDFWAPLFRTPQPVLICIPSPVVYLPSRDLQKRHVRTHPEKYLTYAERLGGADLNPNDTLQWKDMIPNADLYVSKYDSYVAGQMSVIFDRIGKPSQVRSLNRISFEDLRDSPAVLIGAFSNRWTLDLAGKLLFSFDEGEVQTIREGAPPGRVWRSQLDGSGKLTRDYAIVSRLPNSSTGQAIIIAAGIEPEGTEAAGEFLSHPEYRSTGLRSAPPGWQKMNFQAVLQTDVTDGVAGPPQVVATRFW